MRRPAFLVRRQLQSANPDRVDPKFSVARTALPTANEPNLPPAVVQQSADRSRERIQRSETRSYFVTHLPSGELRTGSSSIMNWVLPIAPIMCVPVARYHFSDISSPVWQPQL